MSNSNGGGGVGGAGAAGNLNAPNSFPINYTLEACERIKEEYAYLQSQIQSLKNELDKLIQEKSEMQRHYVMVSTLLLPELLEIAQIKPEKDMNNLKNRSRIYKILQN
jgi:hypothetical protein